MVEGDWILCVFKISPSKMDGCLEGWPHVAFEMMWSIACDRGLLEPPRIITDGARYSLLLVLMAHPDGKLQLAVKYGDPVARDRIVSYLTDLAVPIWHWADRLHHDSLGLPRYVLQ